MGQSMGVVGARMLRPGVARFELDRSLTGTGHEWYGNPDDASGTRPCDVLAARLLSWEAVRTVHVLSNIVTITVEGNIDLDEITPVIEDLFIHYRSGVLPTAV